MLLLILSIISSQLFLIDFFFVVFLTARIFRSSAAALIEDEKFVGIIFRIYSVSSDGRNGRGDMAHMVI